MELFQVVSSHAPHKFLFLLSEIDKKKTAIADFIILYIYTYASTEIHAHNCLIKHANLECKQTNFSTRNSKMNLSLPNLEQKQFTFFSKQKKNEASKEQKEDWSCLRMDYAMWSAA